MGIELMCFAFILALFFLSRLRLKNVFSKLFRIFLLFVMCYTLRMHMKSGIGKLRKDTDNFKKKTAAEKEIMHFLKQKNQELSSFSRIEEFAKKSGFEKANYAWVYYDKASVKEIKEKDSFMAFLNPFAD